MEHVKKLEQKIFGHDPYEGFQLEWADLDYRSTPSKYSQLLKIVHQQQPELIVIVGTGRGAAAIEVAKSCRKKWFSTEIVCIDTWLGTASDLIHKTKAEQTKHLVSLRQVNGFPQQYYTFMRNVVDADMQEYITPLPQTAEQAAKILLHYKAKPQIIYLDDGPDTQPLYRNLMYYWKILRPGGVIIGPDPSHAQVKPALKKFEARAKCKHEVVAKNYLFTKPGDKSA